MVWNNNSEGYKYEDQLCGGYSGEVIYNQERGAESSLVRILLHVLEVGDEHIVVHPFQTEQPHPVESVRTKTPRIVEMLRKVKTILLDAASRTDQATTRMNQAYLYEPVEYPRHSHGELDTGVRRQDLDPLIVSFVRRFRAMG